SGGGGCGGAVRAGRARVRGPERRAGVGGGARTRGGQERSFARLPRHVLRHEARNGVDQLVARAGGQGLEEVLEITLYRRSVRSVALDDADLEHLLETLRSEEHTSELQSRFELVCRLLLEKKKLQSGLCY